MAKILITGATSKTAEALTNYLLSETLHEIVLISSQAERLEKIASLKIIQASIADFKEVKNICLAEKPNYIVNTAAMTDVDRCEDDKELASRINAGAVEHLASISRILSAHLIIFSTDFIFDGKKGPYSEDSVPNPISYYGRTKLAAENSIRTGLDKFTIIRTNVLYGTSSYDKNDFIRWVMNKLIDEEEIKIIDGQYCNPTYIEDLALVIGKIIDKNRYGIYNTGGADYLNRYEIALKVAKVFELNSDLIKCIPSASLTQKAKRPERGGLINLKATTDLGVNFCKMEDGLVSLRNRLNNDNKYNLF